MPLATDIEVSDNLTVNFGKSRDKKMFRITLVNKGKRSLKLKQIRSYSRSVAVVSFEKEHAVIESGGQLEYLFEAKWPSDDSTEGKIRFSFNNRMHVTRTYKFILDKSESIIKNKIKSKADTKPVKAWIKKDEMKNMKTNKKKNEKKGKVNDAKEDAKKDVEKKAESKIESVVEKVEVPTTTLKRGLLRVDWTDKSSELMNRRNMYLLPIQIADDLSIEFGHDHCDKSCEILIHNNTWHSIYLESIRCDLKSITVRGGSNNSVAKIKPREEFRIILDAQYVPCRYDGVAKVWFYFKNMAKPILRSIDVFYREKGPVIQKILYDPPVDLKELIYLEKQWSKSKVFDTLDACVPSISENYAKYFHNLLYLEEIGLIKEFEETYNQTKALFNDGQWVKENGREKKLKFGHGIYDLEVKNLFDTRPPLQVGDKLIVRKRSALNVRYEGVIIDLKESKMELIAVKFGDDFVATFDFTPYHVEFVRSRTYFIEQHFAVDMVLEIFGAEILLPTEISLRGKPLLREDEVKGIRWVNRNLNSHQKQAVTQIIRGDLLNPYVIFGPPGTGKTTTLVEIILQVLAKVKGSKILITTQSNSAANLITQRLIQSDKVASGNLLRLISYRYSNQCDGIPKDIEQHSKTFNDLALELEEDGKEVNFYERLDSVKKFRVVIGTFSTVAKLLEADSLRNHFTHSVNDEAGQCTEPDVLVPMALIGKNGQVIMAGDPMQMPPLVINKHVNSRGLSVSMFGRLIDCYTNFNNDDAGHKKVFGPLLISKLVHNYRSLPSLLDYTNKQFYNSELIPMIDPVESREAKSLKLLDEQLKQQLYGIFPDSRGTYGNYFVNVTSGRNQKAKTSWYNVDEVNKTKTIVNVLLRSGLKQDDIGIITPYALQVKALKKCHEKSPDIKIGTVEDFQGLERKIILISTVRTCSAEIAVDVTRHLGFVKCPKRINVAMSRARVMVIVIGRAELLSCDENWRALIDRCKENNTYSDM